MFPLFAQDKSQFTVNKNRELDESEHVSGLVLTALTWLDCQILKCRILN